MSMARVSVSATLALLGLLALNAQACVYLMGDALDSLKPQDPLNHWTYAVHGSDWNGTCAEGLHQSPINIHHIKTLHRRSHELSTKWHYSPLKSNGSNIQVFNNGHTIQVQWAPEMKSKVQIQTAGKNVLDVLTMRWGDKIKTVEAIPLQFHFHAGSEHTLDGVYYPLELHIVHVIPKSSLRECPETGCLTVTGIMFKMSDDDKDNELLAPIWAKVPMREGKFDYMPEGTVLDLEKFLPKNREYAQYSGSLTTPPCTEGLLWHVMLQPQTISVKQLNAFQLATGLKTCVAKKSTPAPARRLGEGMTAIEETVVPAFKRGSYSGFTHVAEPEEVLHSDGRRSLMEQTPNEADNWECTCVGHAATNRNVQHLNDRSVHRY